MNERFAALQGLKSNGGQMNRFGSLAQLLNRTTPSTYGGKNAVTAVEKYGRTATDYLAQNQGYAKIVGVQFDEQGKIYDYLDPKGTVRTGDTPTVEVTHPKSGKNTFVPGRHTRVVNTGKGGIEQNAAKLDQITNKGINLKVIKNQQELRQTNSNIGGGE
jgi:hypothetical protein